MRGGSGGRRRRRGGGERAEAASSLCLCSRMGRGEDVCPALGCPASWHTCLQVSGFQNAALCPPEPLSGCAGADGTDGLRSSVIPQSLRFSALGPGVCSVRPQDAVGRCTGSSRCASSCTCSGVPHPPPLGATFLWHGARSR